MTRGSVRPPSRPALPRAAPARRPARVHMCVAAAALYVCYASYLPPTLVSGAGLACLYGRRNCTATQHAARLRCPATGPALGRATLYNSTPAALWACVAKGGRWRWWLRSQHAVGGQPTSRGGSQGGGGLATVAGAWRAAHNVLHISKGPASRWRRPTCRQLSLAHHTRTHGLGGGCCGAAAPLRPRIHPAALCRARWSSS